MTDLEAAVQLLGGPTNKVIYDDAGLPSIMVFFEAKSISDSYRGLVGDSVAPAFKVNGNDISGFWLSKYNNMLINGKGYSLPLQQPHINITYTESYNACRDKGTGWHLYTNAERAYISAMCRYINEYIPRGNNSFGTGIAKYETGIRCENNTNVVLTGSGPVTWTHDGTTSGVCDLCGNINNYISGLRLVYGEIQVIADNDAADTNNPENATSTLWKAINTSGTLIQPSGDGNSPNSLRYFYDSSADKICLDTVSSEGVDKYKYFKDIYTTLELPNIVKLLGLYPDNEFYGNEGIRVSTGISEAMATVGGNYGGYGLSGLAMLDMMNITRTNKSVGTGFRSAYIAELAGEV